MSLYIGIDPGVTTGAAGWISGAEEFYFIQSGTLIETYHSVRSIIEKWDGEVVFRIEDARKRKWFGKNSKGKQQGAGSVKRDSKIWEEICKYHDWNYELIHPIKGATKWDADKFKRVTGHEGRTNQNARDAAMMVFKL